MGGIRKSAKYMAAVSAFLAGAVTFFIVGALSRSHVLSIVAACAICWLMIKAFNLLAGSLHLEKLTYSALTELLMFLQ